MLSWNLFVCRAADLLSGVPARQVSVWHRSCVVFSMQVLLAGHLLYSDSGFWVVYMLGVRCRHVFGSERCCELHCLLDRLLQHSDWTVVLPHMPPRLLLAFSCKLQRLLAGHPAPLPGDFAQWRDESHRLLPAAYPDTFGSLLPIVSETFNRQAHAIADRRIVDAGYRLGWLLETNINAPVPRETK